MGLTKGDIPVIVLFALVMSIFSQIAYESSWPGVMSTAIAVFLMAVWPRGDIDG